MIRLRTPVLLFSLALACTLGPGNATAQCVGDCNEDGFVRIGELIQGVNIALDRANVDSCPSFDANDDGAVRIGELIAAVGNALDGCPPAPTATPTPSGVVDTPTATPMTVGECGNGVVEGEEECDDGMHCARGDEVGEACTTDAECGDIEGACELRSGDGCQSDCSFPVCGDGFVDSQPGTCDDSNVCVGPNPAAGSSCTQDSDCLGETCDDGNTEEGADDSCPANCRVASCIPTGERFNVNVNFASNPTGTIVSGLELFVRYAEDALSIPGSANAPEVIGRIASPGDVFTSITPNDRNYGLVLVLFDSTLFGVDPGTAVSVEFDRCEGTAAPSSADFDCTVNSASDVNLADVTDQISCEVQPQ